VRTRWRQRGFSLPEVLASLTLFALVAAATVSLSTTTVRHTADNRAGLAAAFLAQQEMEHMRGHDYENMGSETYSQVVDGMPFTVNANVVTDQPISGVATITVSVSWQGPYGAKHYAIQSYFTDITA
jgi:prepilin-type N-terminal cleavage/methylation domain-containing protein